MAAWSQPNHMNTCLALGWTRELFPVPSERPPCSDLMAQELLDRLLVPLVPPLQVLFALVLLELGLPFSFLSPSGTRKCCHCAGRDRPLDSPETLLEFQDTRIAGSCKWTACVSVGADGVERSSAGGWGHFSTGTWGLNLGSCTITLVRLGLPWARLDQSAQMSATEAAITSKRPPIRAITAKLKFPSSSSLEVSAWTTGSSRCFIT